tara:strand:- start:1954 stop:2238 length:285 start_codon:yes stop_codon:yes gene_type:complete
VQAFKTLPRWQVGLFLYLWSVPLLVMTLWLFDLRFEYDGDLLFWVIAAYIFPIGAIKEMSGVEFCAALVIYCGILTVATAWLLRSSRNADQAGD